MPSHKREQLLAVAAAEFADAGYERASLNRIIRTCGLSKSSFYHYVSSKRQLFDDVLRHYGSALVAELDIPAPEQLERDFWNQLEALMGRLLQAGAHTPGYLLLGRMFYLPGAPADDGSALDRSSSAISSWLSAVVEVGRRTGAIRTDLPADLQEAVTLAVLRAFDEWSVQRSDTGADDLHQIAADQFSAFRRLLAPS